MRQIMKQRRLLFLLFTYISLEAFRHTGWMLFYEQFEENTRQEINLGFILYSGVIAIIGMMALFIFKHILIMDKVKKQQTVFLVSVSLALLFRMIQLCTGLTGACIFLVIWTSAVMVGICLCFMQIYKTVPRCLLGRFFGIAYFADALIVSFVERFTGMKAYFYVSIIVGIVLCLNAGILYVRYTKNTEEITMVESDWKPSKRFVGISLTILVLYVLIAGTMDNLYFFDEWMKLPYIGVLIPFMGIMYLLSGFLVDKLRLRITIPLALLFICIAQSMTYFVTEGIFSYFYSFFSNLGSTFLQLVTVIVPICYARIKKKSEFLSSFGEGLFYGGFCITSIIFVFINQSAYRVVMGGILLTAIICLLLMIELLILLERDKHNKAIEIQKLEMNALKQQVSISNTETIEALPIHEEALNIHFTKREKELMPLIVSSLTAEEIANQSHLSVSTIRFHIKNILGKTDAKNRRELMRMFSEHKLQNDTSIEKHEE